MASEPTVVLTVVESGTEAEMMCELLRNAGIACGYRDTEAIDSAMEEFIAGGPSEILVHEADLETARAVLAARDA